MNSKLSLIVFSVLSLTSAASGQQQCAAPEQGLAHYRARVQPEAQTRVQFTIDPSAGLGLNVAYTGAYLQGEVLGSTPAPEHDIAEYYLLFERGCTSGPGNQFSCQASAQRPVRAIIAFYKGGVVAPVAVHRAELEALTSTGTVDEQLGLDFKLSGEAGPAGFELAPASCR